MTTSSTQCNRLNPDKSPAIQQLADYEKIKTGKNFGLVLACTPSSALYYLEGNRRTASVGSVAFTFYALMAEGVRRIGASRASVVSTVGPPTTILFGARLFDEQLRRAQCIGAVRIVAGVPAFERAQRPVAAAASQAG